MDLLATNLLGRAMHDTMYTSTGLSTTSGPPNFARFTFLDLDAAHHFYPDWDAAADTCVSILHTEAGRDALDKALHDLVGELSTLSADFRRRWSAHNVRYHGAGTKAFHHRDVGDLALAYESVDCCRALVLRTTASLMLRPLSDKLRRHVDVLIGAMPGGRRQRRPGRTDLRRLLREVLPRRFRSSAP